MLVGFSLGGGCSDDALLPTMPPGNRSQGLRSESQVRFLPTASTSAALDLATAIDENDVATWPRFEFEELGFSLQLPLEKEQVKTQYEVCANGKRFVSNTTTIVSCDPRSNYYYYSASSAKNVFLSSFVGTNYESGELGTTLLTSGDLVLHGKEYTIDGFSFFSSKTVSAKGVTFVVVGVPQKKSHFQDSAYRLTHVVFNLPQSRVSKFRTAQLYFYTSEMHEDRLVKIFSTIKFLN